VIADERSEALERAEHAAPGRSAADMPLPQIGSSTAGARTRERRFTPSCNPWVGAARSRGRTEEGHFHGATEFEAPSYLMERKRLKSMALAEAGQKARQKQVAARRAVANE
jgi:hypothetical protein